MTERERERESESNLNSKLFVLDGRSILTYIGDMVLYIEDGKINCRKVWDERCVEGNYEVKVMGDGGGWKREFYKLAED